MHKLYTSYVAARQLMQLRIALGLKNNLAYYLLFRLYLVKEYS